MTELHANELAFNGYTAVLLHYEDGQQALWITDEYLAGRVDDPQSPERYTLNDINHGDPISTDDDLNAAIEDWKRAVEWNDPA